MGLSSYTNTSYGKGLTAAVDHHPERFAVIDVGTNSVKFHIGERQPDGSWRRVVDRAEMSRLGEGVNENQTIQPEPLARTADAVADMVEEARREGVPAGWLR